jgi:hypothetical protein
MKIVQIGRLLFALTALPSLVLAQRGMAGPGGMAAGRGAKIARDPGIEIPRQVNGINLLIEHRQELMLSDTQFVRVIALKRGLDSTNSPLMRRLDSLQRTFKGGSILFGAPSAERRDSLSAARAVVRETDVAVHENIVEWRDKAYALLSSSQLTRAQELEEKAERELAEQSKGKGRGG